MHFTWKVLIKLLLILTNCSINLVDYGIALNPRIKKTVLVDKYGHQQLTIPDIFHAYSSIIHWYVTYQIPSVENWKEENWRRIKMGKFGVLWSLLPMMISGQSKSWFLIVTGHVVDHMCWMDVVNKEMRVLKVYEGMVLKREGKQPAIRLQKTVSLQY